MTTLTKADGTTVQFLLRVLGAAVDSKSLHEKTNHNHGGARWTVPLPTSSTPGVLIRSTFAPDVPFLVDTLSHWAPITHTPAMIAAVIAASRVAVEKCNADLDKALLHRKCTQNLETATTRTAEKKLVVQCCVAAQRASEGEVANQKVTVNRAEAHWKDIKTREPKHSQQWRSSKKSLADAKAALKQLKAGLTTARSTAMLAKGQLRRLKDAEKEPRSLAAEAQKAYKDATKAAKAARAASAADLSARHGLIDRCTLLPSPVESMDCLCWLW